VTEPGWQSLLREASQLRADGRVDEAIAAYQRLLAVKPDLGDSWYNLAWLQRQSRAFDDALTSYQRALDLDVVEPEEVHLNRAVIYSDHLHRPDEAMAELEAALEKNPNYVPALLNLGNLQEDLGERGEAQAAYARALEIEPANSLVLARLAGVSHSPEPDPTLAARLMSAIERPEASAAEQADLGFALGALLDASGQYDAAFDAYRAANAASRDAAGTAGRYVRSAQEDFVNRSIAAFDQPALPNGNAAPVFLLGLFRSGSTLVEQILGSHGRVEPGGELDLIPTLVSRIDPYPEAVASADPETVARWREFYLKGLPIQPSADRLLTDKRPDNFLHVGLIKTLFPGAKIVHTRRHPLDNLLSLYFLHLDPGMAYALDLDDAAHWYGQYRRLMVHWKALYPNDIFDVDYDALVRDPRPVIAGLLDFLGLEWEDSCLDFHRQKRAVKTASVWQVRKPLHSRSSGRWRNYRRHLEGIRALVRN
jgi:tetratricopeptide (TPR) repeat protein